MAKWGDKALVCKKCGKDYVFTSAERQEYGEKGWFYEPSRCPDCRGKNGSAPEIAPPHKIVCASCQAEVSVGNGQPVYCKSCLQFTTNQHEATARRLEEQARDLESQLRIAQSELAEKNRAITASEALNKKHAVHVQALEKELHLAQETNQAHQETIRRLELRIENLELRERLATLQETKAFADRFEHMLRRIELDTQKGQQRSIERMNAIEQQMDQLKNRSLLDVLFSRQRTLRQASDS
ncbi:MAG: zinc-ribbon domain containing protein [Chloroflexi bacterium]|nr:zinc-ribbon domain containing protein [Chloroflexota bacterium]